MADTQARGKYKAAAPTLVEGQENALLLDINGNLKVTTTASTADAILVDDDAFTPATSNVDVVGFLADETTTDSVDEGDIGAARMTLDRKLIIASNVKDDAPPSANSYTTLIGGFADETAADSVDEGDTGALRMTLDRRLLTAGQTTDDAAPETGTRVNMIGGLFDDTGTDSVDEGDAGYARITGDRKLIEAGAYVDDLAITPAGANTYGVLIGAIADETGPDSVDEGDFGGLRMTLTRFLKTSQGDLISGEDQTNNLIQVVQKPTAVSTYTYTRDSSTALEASSIAKASAGNLYQAFGVIDATAPTDIYYIQFLDSATLTADGAVTHLITPIPVNHVTGTDSSFDTGHFDFGVAAANGIVIVISTTMVLKAISGSYLFSTVLYK